MDVPVTVLSDGGEGISHACQLPAAAERVLDWFHIGMRFEHLLTSLRGLRGATSQERAQAILSAGAEYAVDYVIGQRMKRNGQMR